MRAMTSGPRPDHAASIARHTGRATTVPTTMAAHCAQPARGLGAHETERRRSRGGDDGRSDDPVTEEGVRVKSLHGEERDCGERRDQCPAEDNPRSPERPIP